MKRSLICLILVLLMAISMVGCSNTNTSSEPASNSTEPSEKSSDFPSRPITWIVPWKPGGANDICARLIAPELEKILGVPVKITNTEGAGGWIGYDMLLSSDADGYTICSVSLPGMIANYLNPDANRKNTYKDFAPLVNFARDYIVVCIRPDEDRFSTFKEIYEYSKTHELTVAGTSGAGDDGIAIAQFNLLEGAKFVQLATTGSSESLTNLLGKHADICVMNVSEVGNPIKAGQIKVVAAAAPERVKQLPEVPTILEETGVSIIADSSRGIITKAGVPEDALKILTDAIIEALQTPSLKEQLAAQGIEVEILQGEDYEKYMQEVEEMMAELGPKYFGWKINK
ncbi:MULTISPECIES: tripartite tricarboxylate transporter substrate binding protein [Tepidanaerobacter]|uniref:tripartite tricarboxylate transporter substrate binding protein n=1 Tax=Tepidanaerobacter TaxID=499228 RepID=UPI000A5241AA|nr:MULTISPECIES: tripartite tricarboxylate transporter substrate binding protein [Tepidanaerobacter]GLI51669.1 hypothetical protein TSYNTROOL_17550 [Tepidanaerobacter syntrophicus]HHV84155.1 tripartite tricarboxylate transporter substrate binding protein [Tepidanaerobacter syntrophicus]